MDIVIEQDKMSEVRNKLHLEKLQEIMQNLQPDEAHSLIKILVRRYPTQVLREVDTYIVGMKSTINAFETLRKESGDGTI